MNETNRTKEVLDFISSLLFDTDIQEQFFKECKELGIVEDENEDTN